MKSLKVFVLGLLFVASAQGQVSVNVNLGTPPVWAPTKAVTTQYYYLPDIDTYYDVPAQRFIYVKNGKWIRAQQLPARYSAYNLKGGNIIFLSDYKGNAPYKYHKKHKVKYIGNRYQPTRVIYVKDKHDNGKHKGHHKQGKKNNNTKHGHKHN